ncbi:MAG: methyltransferase domain-containing protein [Proteobacteria bacterium]|nr:methyltransferase domain-containing protein [Pseudomonadota bacterium]
MARYALAGWLPFGRRHCVICGHAVWRFMPFGRGWAGVPPLMIALKVVGSDPEHFECPRCGAHDRERHLLLYLRASKLLDDMHGKLILHFAPEKRLSKWIRAAEPAEYVPCDLYPQSPEVQRVDMLAMDFAAEMFDVVIANHVLEHVGDVDKALAEIRRVLKPAGCAILQTPYSSKLCKTWEDPGVDTESARLQAYGQEDHVRLFGRHIFGSIESAGFDSKVQTHAQLLPDVDARSYGVNPAEPFFLFQKSDG